MERIPELLQKIITAFGLDLIHYSDIVFYFLVIVFAFLIELVSLGWESSSLKQVCRPDNSARTDMISCLVDVFNLSDIIAFILSFGICYYLTGLIQKSFHLNLILEIHNIYLQFIIIFLVGDLKEYIRHRFFHILKPLWKLHEFHHSATRLNIFTQYRGHFLETSISRFFDVIPYIIFGVPLHTYFIVKVCVELHHLLTHSSLQSNWGFLGEYIFVSPAAHRLHHSIQHSHYNTNFGSTLIIWDKLFGTYHPYELVNTIGLPDNPYNKKGYIHDVFLSIRQFAKSIFPFLKS